MCYSQETTTVLSFFVTCFLELHTNNETTHLWLTIVTVPQTIWCEKKNLCYDAATTCIIWCLVNNKKKKQLRSLLIPTTKTKEAKASRTNYNKKNFGLSLRKNNVSNQAALTIHLEMERKEKLPLLIQFWLFLIARSWSNDLHPNQ